MTREEAILCLKGIKNIGRDMLTEQKDFQECLDMAIKALEQEPCDCISRQAVLNLMADYDLSMGQVVKGIHALPPATPKPKTGHWILQPSNKEQGERDFIWWKCSKCGQVIYSETEQDRREYHAYCGRCGAKMLPTDSESEEKE